MDFQCLRITEQRSDILDVVVLMSQAALQCLPTLLVQSVCLRALATGCQKSFVLDQFWEGFIVMSLTVTRASTPLRDSCRKGRTQGAPAPTLPRLGQTALITVISSNCFY